MRKLFKHICMICLALAVAVGSFFVPIRKPNRSQMASANDSSLEYYSFTGSNVIVPLYYSGTGRFLLNFKSNFYFDLSNNTLNVDFKDCYIMRIDTGDTYSTIRVGTNTSFISIPLNTSSDSTSLTLSAFGLTASFQVVLQHQDLSSFTGNIEKVEFFNDFNLTSQSNYYQFIKYFDYSGVSLDFVFTSSKSLTYAVLDNRVYYLVNTIDDSDAYNSGYLAGLQDAQDDVYNSGYNTGFDDGKALGKTEGVAEANDYSFISLFGGLFDAPVAMLMGLLNFEFLGINLWAFVTSLFTLALVLFIVKLIMGR